VLGATESWVAVLDERIVGALVCVLEPDHLLVENLAVDPEAQGRGLGGRLLGLAEEQAVAKGVAEVRLYTNEVMVENLRFYASRGYRETGRESRGGFGRVFLAKSLSQPSPG
jgi:ribosomal protein S18 acetylase RimI-like enzyme